MGTKNKERRAAKARRRAREQARQASSGKGWSSHPPGDRQQVSASERVQRMFGLALSAARRADEGVVADAVIALADEDSLLVDREAEGMFLRCIGRLWSNGWLPAEVVRHVRRADARAGRLVAAAVAADHSIRDRRTLHPRWAAHVDALELPDVSGITGWIGGFTGREVLDRWSAVTTFVVALRVLDDTGALNTIIPPPGATTSTTWSDARPGIDDPVLVRVRALLAQAESTTFEAEAEVFTAKAQALMARHSIDAAVLWAGSAGDERPITIRLGVDDPYADIKGWLLHVVARRSRCQAIAHSSYGLYSVVGFASDVAATEMLFTSLLVQSHAALQAEAASTGPGLHARSRSFRSSFLMAYARRIDGRLSEINERVEASAAAEHSESLLPVLAARDGAVDGAVAEMFTGLRQNVVRGGSDRLGQVRGTMAADRAQLTSGDLEEPGRRR